MKHIQSLSTVGTVYSGQVENLEILETMEITEKQLSKGITNSANNKKDKHKSEFDKVWKEKAEK